MKFNIKQLGLCMMLGAGATFTSCNDLLDLEPIVDIMPDEYYTTADQFGAYINNYYNGNLFMPYSGSLYHAQAYNDGMARSDGNTDIMLTGLNGSTSWYAAEAYQETSAGKQLQGYYNNVRVFNYFINLAETKFEAGQISGSEADIKHYIGEGYFFRAMNYFRMLAYYGDLPIVDKVLEVADEEIVAYSKRDPRNEVARFILKDLDKAASLLKNRAAYNGQRLSREVALLFKSRVALFEGTFEKYHKGSGRVPGDSEWPGKNMAYNSGKTFDIDNEVKFFLTEAINAAKEVAENANLTANNHVMNPAVGTSTGWNPYFEMYSQPSLKNVPEVLMWKQYSSEHSISHDAPYRVKVGSASGYTRTFVESFLCKDGLPIYASTQYQGDKTIDNVKANRDERLQLFVWGESNLFEAVGTIFEKPNFVASNAETRCVTGYQPRKYYTYDINQTSNDQLQGTNACPMFRTAEALLNYMEAYYELNNTLDTHAQKYWKQLRERAGVNSDFDATIAATDLAQEGEWSVYSGTTMVDKTLFNIRRERMNETFSEGLRFADLMRWRSFDRLKTNKWIPEGINLWDHMYTYWDESERLADGSAKAIVSGPEQGKYMRPYSRIQLATNELKDGYTWHEAYYLYPIGESDIRTASADRDVNNSMMYQNIHWPVTAGKALK